MSETHDVFEDLERHYRRKRFWSLLPLGMGLLIVAGSIVAGVALLVRAYILGG